MEFYDLDGVLIRKNSLETFTDLSKWTGSSWIKFSDGLRVDWSGCQISEERASRTLKEITFRRTAYILTEAQISKKLFEPAK